MLLSSRLGVPSPLGTGGAGLPSLETTLEPNLTLYPPAYSPLSDAGELQGKCTAPQMAPSVGAQQSTYLARCPSYSSPGFLPSPRLLLSLDTGIRHDTDASSSTASPSSSPNDHLALAPTAIPPAPPQYSALLPDADHRLMANLDFVDTHPDIEDFRAGNGATPVATLPDHDVGPRARTFKGQDFDVIVMDNGGSNLPGEGSSVHLSRNRALNAEVRLGSDIGSDIGVKATVLGYYTYTSTTDSWAVPNAPLIFLRHGLKLKAGTVQDVSVDDTSYEGAERPCLSCTTRKASSDESLRFKVEVPLYPSLLQDKAVTPPSTTVEESDQGGSISYVLKVCIYKGRLRKHLSLAIPIIFSVEDSPTPDSLSLLDQDHPMHPGWRAVMMSGGKRIERRHRRQRHIERETSEESGSDDDQAEVTGTILVPTASIIRCEPDRPAPSCIPFYIHLHSEDSALLGRYCDPRVCAFRVNLVRETILLEGWVRHKSRTILASHAQLWQADGPKVYTQDTPGSLVSPMLTPPATSGPTESPWDTHTPPPSPRTNALRHWLHLDASVTNHKLGTRNPAKRRDTEILPDYSSPLNPEQVDVRLLGRLDLSEVDQTSWIPSMTSPFIDVRYYLEVSLEPIAPCPKARYSPLKGGATFVVSDNV